MVGGGLAGLRCARALPVTPEAEADVKIELSRWFGAQIARWKPVATHRAANLRRKI